MTALKEFERLESPGIWRIGPDAQRRDVVVSFGEATLVFSDATGQPLTHWSLAATTRVHSSADTVTFSPDPDGTETLELSETLMIDAIEKVGRAMARKRPHPGALRGVIAGALVVSVAALTYFWVPGALIDQANAALSKNSLRGMDKALLQTLEPVTGPACRSARGDRANATLVTRIGREAPMVVVPERLQHPLTLPGGTLVIDKARLDAAAEPAEIAGTLIATATATPSPLSATLEHVGSMGTLHLLTTGELRESDLRKASRGLVSTAPTPAPVADLAEAFEAAHLPAEPWAQGAGLAGQAVLQRQADQDGYSAVLPDRDWIALQTICGF